MNRQQKEAHLALLGWEAVGDMRYPGDPAYGHELWLGNHRVTCTRDLSCAQHCRITVKAMVDEEGSERYLPMAMSDLPEVAFECYWRLIMEEES